LTCSKLQRKHSFLKKLSSLASFYTVTQHAILTHLIPFAKCYVFFIQPTPQIHAISKKSNLMGLTKFFRRNLKCISTLSFFCISTISFWEMLWKMKKTLSCLLEYYKKNKIVYCVSDDFSSREHTKNTNQWFCQFLPTLDRLFTLG
jgi:hypothetical protein